MHNGFQNVGLTLKWWIVSRGHKEKTTTNRWQPTSLTHLLVMWLKQCHQTSPSHHHFYRWYVYHSQMGGLWHCLSHITCFSFASCFFEVRRTNLRHKTLSRSSYGSSRSWEVFGVWFRVFARPFHFVSAFKGIYIYINKLIYDILYNMI